MEVKAADEAASIFSAGASMLGYPRVDRSLLDDEEQEIDVQYAYQHIFAVGHGAAADWVVRNGRVAELHTETMPAVEVAQMTADTASASDKVLALGYLSDLADDRSQLVSELTTFVGAYREWSGKQWVTLSSLNSDDQAAGQRIVKRIDESIARMQSGIALLPNSRRMRCEARRLSTFSSGSRHSANAPGMPSPASASRSCVS